MRSQAITQRNKQQRANLERNQMILSPCRTCINQCLSKEMCIATCEKLKAIQELQWRMMVPPYPHAESSNGIPAIVNVMAIGKD
jgi:hypothetical protein